MNNLKSLKGLRNAASETRNSLPNRNCYIQISYDQDDGTILTDFHCSIGQNSWSRYRDHSIVTVCITSTPMTMQEIADEIKRELDYPSSF